MGADKISRADVAHLMSVSDTGGDGVEFSEFLRAVKTIELPEDEGEDALGVGKAEKPKL